MSDSVLPGIGYVDHVGLVVPDLDAAAAFFCDVFGAEELYRSCRRDEGRFMEETFDVPADTGFSLAMLRLPPNLNLELFEWTGNGRRTEFPRACDAGGQHLCLAVADVDAACAQLAQVPGVRLLGEVKQVPAGSPVSGTRWIYAIAPWGQLLELVDRSRVVDPPAFVIPPHP